MPTTKEYWEMDIIKLLDFLGDENPRLKYIIQSKNFFELTNSLNRFRESMDKNASSSDKLAKRIFWLNIILVIATFLGSIAAIGGVILGFCQLFK